MNMNNPVRIKLLVVAGIILHVNLVVTIVVLILVDNPGYNDKVHPAEMCSGYWSF